MNWNLNCQRAELATKLSLKIKPKIKSEIPIWTAITLVENDVLTVFEAVGPKLSVGWWRNWSAILIRSLNTKYTKYIVLRRTPALRVTEYYLPDLAVTKYAPESPQSAKLLGLNREFLISWIAVGHFCAGRLWGSRYHHHDITFLVNKSVHTALKSNQSRLLPSMLWAEAETGCRRTSVYQWTTNLLTKCDVIMTKPFLDLLHSSCRTLITDVPEIWVIHLLFELPIHLTPNRMQFP